MADEITAPPPPVSQPIPRTAPAAIWSLVLAILSFTCGWLFTAIPAVPLTIDGHRALQDELSGTENGTNVVFLHTTVDDGDHFQQILAWTLKSRWQKQNELLREITQTFRSER